jgi:hypothetical protein
VTVPLFLRDFVFSGLPWRSVLLLLEELLLVAVEGVKLRQADEVALRVDQKVAGASLRLLLRKTERKRKRPTSGKKKK